MSSSNGYVTRDALFALPQRRFKDVVVRGLKFRLRSLTEGEWADIEVGSIDLRRGGNSEDGIKSSNVRLLIATVVDADGQPVFTALDTARLSLLDSAIIEPLVRQAREHCGLRETLEDSRKNCETTGEEGLPSSSPEPLATA